MRARSRIEPGRTSEVYNAPLCEIDKRFLCLGSRLIPESPELIVQHKLTHILTVHCENPVQLSEHTAIQKIIQLPDHHGICVFPFFMESFLFIERARKIEGRVLVHCAQGISRSATILIAYIMWSCHVSFISAYNTVYDRRNIGPNPGFLAQLKYFEKELSNFAPLREDLNEKTFELPIIPLEERKPLHSINEMCLGPEELRDALMCDLKAKLLEIPGLCLSLSSDFYEMESNECFIKKWYSIIELIDVTLAYKVSIIGFSDILTDTAATVMKCMESTIKKLNNSHARFLPLLLLSTLMQSWITKQTAVLDDLLHLKQCFENSQQAQQHENKNNKIELCMTNDSAKVSKTKLHDVKNKITEDKKGISKSRRGDGDTAHKHDCYNSTHPSCQYDNYETSSSDEDRWNSRHYRDQTTKRRFNANLDDFDRVDKRRSRNRDFYEKNSLKCGSDDCLRDKPKRPHQLDDYRTYEGSLNYEKDDVKRQFRSSNAYHVDGNDSEYYQHHSSRSRECYRNPLYKDDNDVKYRYEAKDNNSDCSRLRGKRDYERDNIKNDDQNPRISATESQSSSHNRYGHHHRYFISQN